MKRTLSLALSLLPLLGGAVALTGCGSAAVLSSAGSTTATGRATVSIAWPEATRLIPAAANSVTVQFLQGTTSVATRSVARPTSGGQAAVAFEGLPAGELRVIASAYPQADGTGVAQASATTSATIVAGQTTSVNLTMASTIDHLSVTPASPGVAVGSTISLHGTALNAGGSVVLTDPLGWTWTSSDPSVATVGTDGLVTGVALGTAQIQVAEGESGKSAAVSVAVTAPVAVSIAPVTVILSALATRQFQATVTHASNQAVLWSVQEIAGGTISSSGLYTAPSTPGTYHVLATSVADPTKSASATVTIESGSANVTVQ